MTSTHGPGSVEEALDAADRAIATGDWNRVIEITDTVLATEPDHADAAAFRSLAKRQLSKQSAANATERRFLTVMFVDLVGSTAISEQLDPEDFAALLDRYHAVASDAIDAFGGSVVKLLGDGVMAQFGYPRAIEDAPRRACLAGLRLVDDVGLIRDEIDQRFGVPLDCRVGIHSGTAVMQDGDVLGDVPNTAAKLEGAATTGGIAVSDATRSLVEGLFGFRQIVGFDAVDTDAFELLRPEHVSSSVRRASRAGDVVGRRDELAILQRSWNDTMESGGRIVTIVGEAGIGKSRLIEEFRARITEDGAHWIEGGAAEFRSGRPFHVFTDAIERQLIGLGVDPFDTEAAAPHLGMRVAEAALLVTPDEGTSLTPAQARRALMASITGWLERLVADRPSVLAIEDAHWADPSSLALAAEIAEAMRDRPLLIVLTSRTDVSALTSSETIGIQPLTGSEVDILLERLCGDLQLSSEVRRALAERAGGVPLFAHELARTVRTTEGLDVEHVLPQSLRDLLAARLDSCGSAKRTAQLASVYGRSFTKDLVAAIDDTARSVDGDFVELAEGGLIEQVPDIAGGYRFGHSLMQDAAYESLLKSERRTLHAHASSALAALDPEAARRSPDLIAHHLTMAQEYRAAFDHWMQAGSVATARSAAHEAVSHYRHATEVLPELPAEDRDDLEFTIHIAAANPLTAEFGYAASEVEAAYIRAAELAEKSGDPVRRFATTRGLTSTYLLRAEITRASDLGHEALRIAREGGNIGMQLEARSWLGTVEFFAGRLDDARSHLLATAALYDPREHGQHGFEYGIDPLVLADTHRAWLLELSDDDTALDVATTTLEHARSLGHALSVAHALNYLAGLHQMRGEHAAQLRTADEEVSMAVEYGFVHYIHYGRIFAGHAEVRLGDREGLERMESALADRLAAGAALALPYQLYLIADAQSSLGDHRGAADRLVQATDVIRRTGETWWSHRVAGALQQLAGRPA